MVFLTMVVFKIQIKIVKKYQLLQPQKTRNKCGYKLVGGIYFFKSQGEALQKLHHTPENYSPHVI